jgi:hypothetical protein
MITQEPKILGFEAEYNGQKTVFYAKPEHGAFYEVGFNGEIGTLYVPMNADGSPDIQNLGEVEVEWENC